MSNGKHFWILTRRIKMVSKMPKQELLLIYNLSQFVSLITLWRERAACPPHPPPSGPFAALSSQRTITGPAVDAQFGGWENTARPVACLLGTVGPLTIRSGTGGHGLLADIWPCGALPDGILSFLPLSGRGAVGLGLHNVFSLLQLVSQRNA